MSQDKQNVLTGSKEIDLKILTHLFETTKDSVILIQKHGKNNYTIAQVNEVALKDTGYPKDILGKPIRDLFLEKERYEFILKQYSKAESSRKKVVFETNREFPGGLRIFRTTIIPIFQGDICTYFLAIATNFTSETETVEELKQTKRFLNAIIENIPDMIFVKDAKELRFVRFNKAGEKLLGHTREALIGKNDYDFFPKEQADFFTEKDRAVLAGNEVVDIPEEPIDTVHKGKRQLHTKKVPVLDNDGNPLYLLGISEDITEKKKTEQELKSLTQELDKRVKERTKALEQSEEKHRLIVENFPGGVYTLDKDGKHTYASEGMTKLLGYSQEELYVKSFLQMVPPREQEQAQTNFLKILEEGKLEGEISCLRKDGTEIETYFSATAIYKDEEFVGLSGILLDISDLRKAEEDKRKLTEKVAKLTRKVPLTDKEKLVFYGLTKHPLLADQELADKLGVKRSTLTAIKNKLLQNGFYKTHVIPDFQTIGCDLLTVLYSKGVGSSKVKDLSKRLKLSNGVIYTLSTGKHFFSLIISKNFAASKELTDMISDLNEEEVKADLQLKYFPLSNGNFNALFEYSEFLKDLFKLQLEEESSVDTIVKKRKYLSENEKKVLLALVEHPEYTSTQIAETTELSRRTVMQIKNTLLQQHMFKVVNIPDLQKLGCELIVHNYKREPFLNSHPHNMFAIRTKREQSSLSLYESYTKFFSDIEQPLGRKESNDLFIITEETEQSFDFSKITKHLLFETE